MSIKSDRWIREMAEKHGMIEPYAPQQVRSNPAVQSAYFGDATHA